MQENLQNSHARKLAKNKRRTKRQMMKGGESLSEKLQKCGPYSTNSAYFNTLMGMLGSGPDKISRVTINDLLTESNYNIHQHDRHFSMGMQTNDEINCEAIKIIAGKWDALPPVVKAEYKTKSYGMLGIRKSKSLDWLVKTSNSSNPVAELDDRTPLVDPKTVNFRGPKTEFTYIEPRSTNMKPGDIVFADSVSLEKKHNRHNRHDDEEYNRVIFRFEGYFMNGERETNIPNLTPLYKIEMEYDNPKQMFYIPLKNKWVIFPKETYKHIYVNHIVLYYLGEHGKRITEKTDPDQVARKVDRNVLFRNAYALRNESGEGLPREIARIIAEF